MQKHSEPETNLYFNKYLFYVSFRFAGGYALTAPQRSSIRTVPYITRRAWSRLHVRRWCALALNSVVLLQMTEYVNVHDKIGKIPELPRR